MAENTAIQPLVIENRRLNDVANYMIEKGYKGLAKAYILPVVAATATARRTHATVTNEMAIRNIFLFLEKMANDPKLIVERRRSMRSIANLHKKNSRRVFC